MKKNEIRYGVLGLGIGSAHAEAAERSENAFLAAICDKDPARLAKYAEKYPNAHAYADFEDMLAHEELDILSVCLPTGLHAEYACRAMEAGVNVLCEKPLDVSLQAAERVIETEKRTGKSCGVVFQNRYNYPIEPLCEALRDGSLGRIYLGSFAVKWYRDAAYYAAGEGWRGTWRLDGGGSLMNQAIHTVDLMLMLMGEAESVETQMGLYGHDIETEDATVSSIRFKSGAMASFVTTTCAYPGICTEISLTCEKGSVSLDADRMTAFKLMSDPDGSGEAEMLSKYGIGNRRAARETGRIFGHRFVVEDMISAVSEGRRPRVDVEGALPALRLILAMYDSAREGRRVFL